MDLTEKQLACVEATQRLGSQRAAAAELGIQESTLRGHLSRAAAKGITPTIWAGRTETLESEARQLPAKGEVARYVVTSAQNNTPVNARFWRNLLAFANHYGAEVMVSRFSYNKTKFGKKSVKPGKAPTADDLGELWYAPEIADHVCDKRMQLAPGLVFCGEFNRLPTTINPLAGFHTYTGRASAIFPHAKLAMDSVPSMKKEGVKLVYTTGTCTKRNYIQKADGIRAEFHHAYAALLVEVDHAGNWWVRQLNADGWGRFYDLTLEVHDGEVTDLSERPLREETIVEAVGWGDTHGEEIDPDVAHASWGDDDSIIDTLRPRYQFHDDLLSFRRRGKHDRSDFHKMLVKHYDNEERVEDEITKTARVTRDADRSFCKMLVKRSNHCDHYDEWLKNGDYKTDLVNAEFFLESQLAYVRAIKEGDRDFSPTEWALRKHGFPGGADFLCTDESFVICRSAGGGIECGLHGDKGPNGARGSATNLAKLGRKANIGHSHSARIVDGVYQAGTSSHLDLGYNTGPSNWSNSHVVTYRNGKRAILTVWKGKWRA